MRDLGEAAEDNTDESDVQSCGGGGKAAPLVTAGAQVVKILVKLSPEA